MALNPQYILLPPLQNIFRDKDTGLPLRNGYILFFADNQRTIGKEVFQLTGSPPNYTYAPLGQLNLDGSWQVTLDQNGSISNGVNTCNLYWFPYDTNGNIQLYFVQVYNQLGVFQYSLEAEPNLTSNGNSSGEISENFVPNGQFLLHTNLPAIPPNIPAGRVQQAITQIAYGGWTFERPNSSGAQDNVVFSRFGSWGANPIADPRYSCRISCNSPDSGNQFKDLRLRFDNVNRFSSDTLYFTYGFTAQTNTGSGLNLEVLLIKNFGTGGDSPIEISLGTISITSSYVAYFISFIPGDNLNKIIGPNDDDFIQLVVRFPTTTIFDASFTDFLFTEGQFTNTNPPIFPETINSQYDYRSLAGFTKLPDYNSQDLYLNLRLTPTGLEFDHSDVGSILALTTPGVPIGYLPGDGSQYQANLYSPDGIPYSRLQSIYLNTANGEYIPRYGTGQSFLTAYYMTGVPSGTLRISNNSMGIAPDLIDGSSPTGFTFKNIYDGSIDTDSTGIFYGGFNLFIWCKSLGYPLAFATPGTSGFTVNQLRANSAMKSLVSVSVLAPTGLAGLYLTFSNLVTTYYVWYTVDGVGTDPAVVGATGIKIDLLSTWTALDVAQITAAAISGFKQTAVVCTAGSTIPPGSFYNINTPANSYYEWFKVSGIGTDPMVSGKTGIEADILSTDTAIQVSAKAALAINSKYFAVPDLRGMFLRGNDPTVEIDTDALLRWSIFNDANASNFVGSYQLDQIPQISITHTVFGQPGGFGTYVAANPASTGNEQSGILPIGGPESRPINMSVNWVIKY